jgi:hypothetical protein
MWMLILLLRGTDCVLWWELRKIHWQRHRREARWGWRRNACTRELLQHLWRKCTSREGKGLRGLRVVVKPPKVQCRVGHRLERRRRMCRMLGVRCRRIDWSLTIWRLRWIVCLTKAGAIGRRRRILILLRHGEERWRSRNGSPSTV